MSGKQNVCPWKFKFFTFLLPDFSSELVIPRACIEYFIEENSTWATIRSPLGKSWRVKIHGDSNSLHLAEGWERFAAAHKLSAGYLLEFKCKGGLVFDVNIFDLSTCEIDYNAIINGVATNKVPAQEENCEREFECFKKQTAPSCGKRTAAVMESCERRLEGSNKRTVPSCGKTTAAVMEISKREFECSRKQTATSCGQKGTAAVMLRGPRKHEPDELEEQKPQIVQDCAGNRRWKRPSYGETSVGLVKGSQSKEMVTSPQFICTIAPINLRGRGYLNIPRSFLSSVDLSAVHEVTLVDHNSKQWPVAVSHRKVYSRSCIHSGWVAFRSANNLEVGDICIFSFKSGKQKATFQVEVMKSEANLH